MLDGGILILRVVIGIVMVRHGVYKFQKKSFLDKKWKEEFGFPKGSVLLNGIVQVACGLAILGGIFSRLAALILIINMLVATYVSIWKHREPFLSSPEGKGWDINFVLIGALVALVFLGDGTWSLDPW